MLHLPIYMDNHATTRTDPRVVEAMLPYFTERYGNAASKNHVFGWQAEEAVKVARRQTASIIGATDREMVFTSGATESNNLAIKGAALANRPQGNHVITAVTEHKAVFDPCKRLEREGFQVTWLPVDSTGLVDPDAVDHAITAKTILVSIMAANNEIGTVQPIQQIGRICKARGVLFHTDATQAVGKIPLDVVQMGIDLLSFSAHKMYGPKGVGALFIRRRDPHVRLEPILDGGGHEHGLRSGTLPVPLIVGFGVACDLCRDAMPAEADRLARLRDRLYQRIAKRVEGVSLNGHPTLRLAGNLNLSFPFVKGEALLISMKEVAVSSGSACTSAQSAPSHVLKALGLPDDLVDASLRFGLGRFNTEEEVDYAADLVVRNVAKLRSKSPMWEMSHPG
jgi:cysteine desulfurase